MWDIFSEAHIYTDSFVVKISVYQVACFEITL